MPRRKPEKVMTFGQPAAEVSEAFGETVAAGNGANEAFFFQQRPVLRPNEFNGFEAEGGGVFDEFRRRHRAEAPWHDGLANVAALDPV
jgi:hypothetical protein